MMLFGLVGMVIIVSHSRQLTSKSLALFYKKTRATMDEKEKKVVKEEALRRFSVYNELVQKKQLLDGMVVGRTQNGEYLDVCDSLLFSSLRFAALSMMDLQQDAEEAWQAIMSSSENGEWYRHPTCRRMISRDMMDGVMIAFSQMRNPTPYFKQLISFLKENHNFFHKDSWSPVSFVTPGVAETIWRVGVAKGLATDELEFLNSYAFSTIEFSALLANPGYEMHILGLSLWLELELNDQLREKRMQIRGVRSVTWELANLLQPLTEQNIFEQRTQWIASQIYQENDKNLFFKWLYLKSKGLLDTEAKYSLLKELVEMKQFPKNSLPMNCDRKADYLWQRKKAEYEALSLNCVYTFPGTDYLWMSALLIRGIREDEGKENDSLVLKEKSQREPLAH